MSTVRVRFAPSPTGHLHIGSLRTALFNWLFARHTKGAFLIRIEDTDRERSKPEYTKSILDAFAWVGITADEPIVIQSERLSEYTKFSDRLLKEGKAYKCYCTQEDVVARVGLAAAATGEDELFVQYDGLCRDRTDQPNKPHVVRYKLPATLNSVVFQDIVRGEVIFERDQLDDFIIVRSDGWPIYNFVVVVDDAFMRITHIIRGEEHLVNTPKQILLAQACGFNVPEFAHLPVILNPSGRKLSKRDGAVAVTEYKAMGYLPEALLNYLVRLGWAHGDQEVFTQDELIQFFSLESVGKKAAVFDVQKLNWLNGVYIKNSTASEVLAYIIRELDSEFRNRLGSWSDVEVDTAIDLYKERVVTMHELMQELMLAYNGPENYETVEIKAEASESMANALSSVLDLLQKQTDFSHDALAASFKTLSKSLSVKLMQLAHPTRVALLGKSNGPGVFDLLVLVGKKTALERIGALRDAVMGFIGDQY